jgi:hypothetical protein
MADAGQSFRMKGLATCLINGLIYRDLAAVQHASRNTTWFGLLSSALESSLCLEKVLQRRDKPSFVARECWYEFRSQPVHTWIVLSLKRRDSPAGVTQAIDAGSFQFRVYVQSTAHMFQNTYRYLVSYTLCPDSESIYTLNCPHVTVHISVFGSFRIRSSAILPFSRHSTLTDMYPCHS